MMLCKCCTKEVEICAHVSVNFTNKWILLISRTCANYKPVGSLFPAEDAASIGGCPCAGNYESYPRESMYSAK